MTTITPAGVERLLAELVAVDSVNPALVPGGAGEGAIAVLVAGRLRDAGLDVEVIDAAGRPSVVGVARGRGGGRSLMLCGHLDTVGVADMADPHVPVVRDGRLHGRGSYDMKAGVAAAMLAAIDVAGAGLSGDVIVAAVADEEHASVGVQAVLERVRADACIVTEPTGLDVVVAHKGFAWWEIEARGRAAHGSRPDLGVDAIAALGPVLVALGALEDELAGRRHPRLGPGSVHAALIEGGAELSTYPERCVLGIERRTLPGETSAQLAAELAALVAAGERVARRPVSGAAWGAAEAGALPGAPAATWSARTLLERAPFEVADDAPIVTAVRGAAAARLGRTPQLLGHSAWMDAAFTSAAGIPTVVFGPDGAGAHADEEWAELDSVRDCAAVLAEVARDVCA
jgi:acetylornithine deacetylase